MPGLQAEMRISERDLLSAGLRIHRDGQAVEVKKQFFADDMLTFLDRINFERTCTR
jgi:hypothetical protein